MKNLSLLIMLFISVCAYSQDFIVDNKIGIGIEPPSTHLHLNKNRDALFGDKISGNGSKLIWDYSSRAIRAGYAAASSWNEDSIGLYSAGFGFGSVAEAYMSFATGFYTHSRTYAGFSTGRYNVGASGNSTAWTTTDPLFEVGNGTSNTNRNNAFTIRKDGLVGINDATPDYMLDIENRDISLRSIYINHNITSSPSPMYGIFVNADNTAVNSGTSYGAYIDMRNNNDDAYGIYSLAYSDASDGSPVYGVYSFVDNDNGTGLAYSIYGSVAGSTSGTKYAGYFNGNVFTTGSYLPSDRSLKKEINPISNALDKILRIQVNSYNYDLDKCAHMSLPEGQRIGFLADNIQQVIPGLVKRTVQPETAPEEVEEGVPYRDALEFDAVDYTGMIPYLVSAVQELNEKVVKLQNENDELTKKVNKSTDLESQIRELRRLIDGMN